MATFSARSASLPPPSRTPAGLRASSRHVSIAPRTTSAHGPLAWAAPRTRTHRSIPAPPKPAGASRLPRTPLETVHPFGNGPDKRPGCWAFEVRIVRAHVDETLVADGTLNHINPDKWRPLIMSFCRFYGLSGEVHRSTLADIPDEAYRPASTMSR